MSEVFVNKVAQSGLITLDLASFFPNQPVKGFDLKPFLFMEMILKEKDFREQLKVHDWTAYADTHVAVHCSADAIIPVWAYMLVASYLEPVAAAVRMGSPEAVKQMLLCEALLQLDTQAYAGERVVVKGCGEEKIDAAAYLVVAAKLVAVAKSVMYGEPCSTVPIFKRK